MTNKDFIQETSLFQAAKKAMPESFDIEHYLENLFLNPENKWFYPTNDFDDNYTICRELAMLGLICERKAPKWSSGAFRGFRFEFLYSRNMVFDKI